jgi:hypothetical protein
VSPLIVRRNGVVKGIEFKENFNAGLASRVRTHGCSTWTLITMAATGWSSRGMRRLPRASGNDR